MNWVKALPQSSHLYDHHLWGTNDKRDKHLCQRLCHTSHIYTAQPGKDNHLYVRLTHSSHYGEPCPTLMHSVAIQKINILSQRPSNKNFRVVTLWSNYFNYVALKLTTIPSMRCFLHLWITWQSVFCYLAIMIITMIWIISVCLLHALLCGVSHRGDSCTWQGTF